MSLEILSGWLEMEHSETGKVLSEILSGWLEMGHSETVKVLSEILSGWLEMEQSETGKVSSLEGIIDCLTLHAVRCLKNDDLWAKNIEQSKHFRGYKILSDL